MEMRPVDRLILVMLSEIHEKLEIKDGVDTKFLKAALYGGHTWALDWDWPGITQVEETEASVVSEVVNILDMYDMLELSFDGLTAGEQAAIGEYSVRFHGFDGNDETAHMSAARFFVDEMDRFTRFKGRDFNSHMPVVGTARRMLEIYGPLRSEAGMRASPRLTADEISQVLAA
jgi:uncharacterized protein YfbU (UPF0304 family)